MSVVPFPDRAEQESARLQAIHADRIDLDNLAADAGSPREWLATAVSHLKAQVSGNVEGSATVSAAAVHLVLFRLEELEHDGEPWRGDGK